MNKRVFLGMGIFLGLIAAGAIYPLLGRLSYKANINEVSKWQTQKFMGDSKEISNSFHSYTYKSSYYKNALRTKSVRKEDYIFYDNLHKKFFSIETFDGIYVLDGLMDASKNDTIVSIVNVVQLNDPAYGTQTNPIPIFKSKITPKKSWNNYAKSCLNDLERFNDNYPIAVFNYLTYFLSNQDLKKICDAGSK